MIVGSVAVWSLIPGGSGVLAQPLDDTVFFAAPEDGGPRRWVVSAGPAPAHAAPSTSANQVREFENGAILSNFGCVPDADIHWCEVHALRGGARSFVDARQLIPAVGPDGTIPLGLNDSKARARKGDFDATGEVRCAQECGEALKVCEGSVSRSDGGDATVVVTFANGFARHLFFLNGAFVSASSTMSGVGTDVDWSVKGGTHYIRVDDQQYEIPDSLVFGP